MSFILPLREVLELLLSLKTIILIEIVFILPGLGVGQWLFRRTDLSTEARTALCMTAGLIVVPFLCGVSALLLGIYNSTPLVILVSCLANLALGRHIKRFFLSLKASRPSADLLLFLASLALVGALYYFIHCSEELFFQLYSWIVKGDAKCFYLQLFKTQLLFQPEMEEMIRLRSGTLMDTHRIICTPANIVIPSTMLVIFGRHGLQVLHALLAVQLAAFSYLTVEILTGRRIFALVALFLSALHPHLLDTAVLDRNFMALSFSSALLYLVVRNWRAPLPMGLLCGFIGGLGLSFLPLGLLLPVTLAAILGRRFSPRSVLLFLVGFLICFSINLPHLAVYPPVPGVHGHALSLERTPYLPFSNALFFPIHFIHYSGTFLTAAALLGLVALLRRHRGAFLLFFPFVLFVYFVVGTQSSWLEADKMRIGMTAYFPIFITITLGLARLIEALRNRQAAFVALFLLLIGLLHLGVTGAGRIEVEPENTYYESGSIYAKESRPYYALIKRHFGSPPIGPNISRIWERLGLGKNRVRSVRNENFLFSDLPRLSELYNIYLEMGLIQWALSSEGHAVEEKAGEIDRAVTVGVDLGRLPDGDWIVSEANRPDLPALDMTDSANRSALFFTEMEPDWQAEPLPVGIKFERGPYLSREEETLVIDLNSYRYTGGEKTGTLDVMSLSSQSDTAYSSGIPHRPCPVDDGLILLRVRREQPMVIRNWLINLYDGSIYRVDSFDVIWKDGSPHGTRFRYDRPVVYF